MNNNNNNTNNNENETINHFNQLLDKLTLSRHSIETTALFAIKNPSEEKNLFYCILNKIERTNENSKLNYLFLIDSICQQIIKLNMTTPVYLNLVEDEMEFIVLKVLPEENPLDSNLVGIRKVLNNWKLKKFFNLNKLKEIESKINQLQKNTGSTKFKSTNLRRSEIMRKIEQHRENHKFIKRSNWLQKSEFHQRKEFDQLMETIDDWDHDVDIPKLIYHNELFLKETGRLN